MCFHYAAIGAYESFIIAEVDLTNQVHEYREKATRPRKLGKRICEILGAMYVKREWTFNYFPPTFCVLFSFEAGTLKSHRGRRCHIVRVAYLRSDPEREILASKSIDDVRVYSESIHASVVRRGASAERGAGVGFDSTTGADYTFRNLVCNRLLTV